MCFKPHHPQLPGCQPCSNRGCSGPAPVSPDAKPGRAGGVGEAVARGGAGGSYRAGASWVAPGKPRPGRRSSARGSGAGRGRGGSQVSPGARGAGRGGRKAELGETILTPPQREAGGDSPSTLKQRLGTPSSLSLSLKSILAQGWLLQKGRGAKSQTQRSLSGCRDTSDVTLLASHPHMGTLLPQPPPGPSSPACVRGSQDGEPTSSTSSSPHRRSLSTMSWLRESRG